MALHRRLITRGLALVATVLLVHGVAIEWVARRHVQAALLRPMVAPMYTRTLTPQAPPPPAPAAAPAPRPAPAARSIAKAPAAPAPRRAASQAQAAAPPEPPAPEPIPTTAPEPEVSASSEAAATAAPSPEAAAAPSGDPADRWPRDTRVTYQLTGDYRGPLYGDARVLWQREGARYQVRVEVDLKLTSLVLTSQGEVGLDGLMPSAFEELRGGKSRALRIGESEVMLANGDILPRPPGVQDTASQFVELSQRFASGREALEVGRAISFWMARPGAVDLWTYDVVERETLRTPRLGEVEAFHLKPRPLANPRGNITAEMWFAPSLQYLPVRIRVNMGTEAHVDLLVESIEQR